MHALRCCIFVSVVLGCSPDLRGTSADYQLLVFPGEAELGASAMAVISSNYLPGGDEYEKYTLQLSQVGVRIKDAADTEWNATVRGVFPLAASAASKLAETRPGAWATAVLFDLPTAAGFDMGNGPPFLADVILVYKGVAQTADERTIGSIRITGAGGAGIGGQPTTIYWPPVTDLSLQNLVVRLRPNLDTDGSGTGDGGFPPDPEGIVIGGIEGDLYYIWACYTDLEPATGSEAADAGIYVGAVKALGSFLSYRRIVVTYPQGFTLTEPAGGAVDALGEGPLIELTFDRPPPSPITCGSLGFVFRNVYVVAPDGSTIADERGIPYANSSSPLFSLHTIPE